MELTHLGTLGPEIGTQPWGGAESGLVAFGISVSYRGQTPCVAGTELGAGAALRAPELLAL